jgi:hypothetical protein
MYVTEFKKKLDEIYRSTESPSQYNAVPNNIKDIMLNDLIRKDEEKRKEKMYGKINSCHIIFVSRGVRA